MAEGVKTRRIIRRPQRSEEAFGYIYEEWAPVIARNARRQFVPGWEHDDVTAVMEWCLWRAYQKHKHRRGDFGVFFWHIWLTEKKQQLRRFYAPMRGAGREVLADDVPEQEAAPTRTVPKPPTMAVTERLVWALLGSGYSPREVQRLLRLSDRRYYSIIRSWRTEDVYQALSSGNDS